jgi:hypothetical protein
MTKDWVKGSGGCFGLAKLGGTRVERDKRREVEVAQRDKSRRNKDGRTVSL